MKGYYGIDETPHASLIKLTTACHSFAKDGGNADQPLLKHLE